MTRALFVWFRVAPEHEVAAVAALGELHAQWVLQGLRCELLRRAEDKAAVVTLMETYRAADGVDASWQERIQREANAGLAPWLIGPRHIEVFEACA